MAIVKMQKLSICAAKKNRKAVLELLQRLGTVEITTDGIDDEELKKMDTASARTKYLKRAESYDRILKLLEEYAPETKVKSGLFSEPGLVSKSDVDEVINSRRTYNQECAKILGDEKEISEAGGTIVKDRTQIAQLVPWQTLGVPMDFSGTNETEVFIGTIPEAVTPENLYANASRDLPEPVAVSAEVLSSSNEQSCVAVVCLKRDRDKVEENLRMSGFARPAQPEHRVPSQASRELTEDISTQEQRIEDLKKDIASYGNHADKYRIAADYYRNRAEKYRVLGTIPQSERVFFLEGWIPAEHAEGVKKVLSEKMDAFVETEEIRSDEVEPTVLKNNQFARNVEGVLESYGLPQHGKVDPSFIMSIFYVIFFGMMLSDAGYGIVMFIACAIILKKYPRMAEGTQKMLRLFFWCGLSTTFWGFMYGSFFGDVIDTVAKTFFGYTGDTILKPLWFEPLTEPMRLLVWCMLFGLIHLFTGLGIKGFELLKDHDYVSFVCDILAWYAFVLGLVLMLLPSSLFNSISGMTFVFPAALNTFARGLAIGGALVILVMSGRARSNWGLRIALGAYDLYNITGWLSDVLSYSRLLALGLATGVIASVINMMASMFGGGVLGAILFIIIFLLGHTLNIGINALGAYVHTNRLQYVEFFGKFYEAGGRPFRPFKNTNQYVELKEEQSL